MANLKETWPFKIKGKAAKGVYPFGSLAVTPIVENGVVYLQDLDSNVYAMSLATGGLVFTTLYDGVLVALETPASSSIGTRCPRRPTRRSRSVDNTVLVPAAGPKTDTRGGHPQLVAFAIPELQRGPGA